MSKEGLSTILFYQLGFNCTMLPNREFYGLLGELKGFLHKKGLGRDFIQKGTSGTNSKPWSSHTIVFTFYPFSFSTLFTYQKNTYFLLIPKCRFYYLIFIILSINVKINFCFRQEEFRVREVSRTRCIQMS